MELHNKKDKIICEENIRRSNSSFVCRVFCSQKRTGISLITFSSLFMQDLCLPKYIHSPNEFPAQKLIHCSQSILSHFILIFREYSTSMLHVHFKFCLLYFNVEVCTYALKKKRKAIFTKMFYKTGNVISDGIPRNDDFLIIQQYISALLR